MSIGKDKKFTLSAYSLRIVLTVLMLVIVAAGAVGLGYGLQTIEAFAIDVSRKKVDANASTGSIQALEKTEAYLDSNKDVLEKIGLLRAVNEFPEFKVVDEVRKIAAKNKIEIVSFSYGSEAATGGSTPASPGATTPPAGTSTPAAGASPSAGGKIALTVTLKTSNYLDFLQFTYDVEQYLPKMKISGIGITNGGTGTDGSSGGITIDPLTVEMYIK